VRLAQQRDGDRVRSERARDEGAARLERLARQAIGAALAQPVDAHARRAALDQAAQRFRRQRAAFERAVGERDDVGW
jgi:hypothetical protein